MIGFLEHCLFLEPHIDQVKKNLAEGVRPDSKYRNWLYFREWSEETEQREIFLSPTAERHDIDKDLLTKYKSIRHKYKD